MNTVTSGYYTEWQIAFFRKNVSDEFHPKLCYTYRQLNNEAISLNESQLMFLDFCQPLLYYEVIKTNYINSYLCH